MSQQEILLWLHSDSFTECRDTAILPPQPICHFSRPNATLNLTALDQVDFSHLGLFVFLGHQCCISCSSWQLFNIFLNSDSRNDYDSLNILASMPCLMRGNLLRTIIVGPEGCRLAWFKFFFFDLRSDLWICFSVGQN